MVSLPQVSDPRGWYRAHFDALPHFGLVVSGSHGPVLQSVLPGPLPLLPLTTAEGLVGDIQQAQRADPWLAQVIRQVEESDDIGGVSSL